MDISETDFRRIDLNLLVTFLVLIEERSVSRAAQRLYLSQPAVSGALARLRELLDDPLLVRGRLGMQPTSRALQLEARLRPALGSVHGALFEESPFDPARAEHTFVIGMPDWVEMWLAPILFGQLQRQAPSVRLSIVNTDPFRIASMLEHGEMDLAVCQTGELPSWCRQHVLRTMPFKSVCAPTGKRGTGKLSLTHYLTLNHLVITYRNTFETPADIWLATQAKRRKVTFASTRFAVLPSLLREPGTMATVPEAIAVRWRSEYGLAVRECPVPLDEVVVSATGLTVRDNDAPLQWLREVLRTAAQDAAPPRR
ncbi:MAG TPA: LysR family transcriptional regulator [Duganella sp.]|jgi:DNA-binding transcriptional LysR family regulator